jgi:hypothetical protein
MSFMSSPDGLPSKYYCQLHHYRLTKQSLKEKRCLEKNCSHLVLWNKVRHRYRKHIIGHVT